VASALTPVLESSAAAAISAVGLPRDWRVVELGDLFDIQQGKALAPEHREGKNPRPFLRTANVLWGSLDLSHLDQMDFTHEETKRFELKQGDLLVCEGGDVGRTAIWDGQVEWCLHQNHVHRLRTTRADVLPEFYMYWMQSAVEFLGIYGGAENRTTIPNLSKGRLSRFFVPLPPLVEQVGIAETLQSIRSAAVATDKVAAAARDLKRSMMQHVFTYGPVPADRAEDVQISETAIGRLPANWSVVRLRDAFETQLGKMLSEKARANTADQQVYLRNKSVQWGRVDVDDLFKMSFDERERKKFKLEPGDLLICEGGEPGRAALWRGELEECYYQKALHRVRPRDRSITNEFLAHWLEFAFRFQNLYAMGASSTIQHLPQVLLEQLLIPSPPRLDQDAICVILSEVDEKIRRESRVSDALARLYRTLLVELTTGRRRIISSPRAA